jgi:hypothetical protein
VHFGGVDLDKADLYMASLSHADLHDAILDSVNFDLAFLDYANLHDTDVNAADIDTTELPAAGLDFTVGTPAQHHGGFHPGPDLLASPAGRLQPARTVSSTQSAWRSPNPV